MSLAPFFRDEKVVGSKKKNRIFALHYQAIKPTLVADYKLPFNYEKIIIYPTPCYTCCDFLGSTRD